MSSNPSCGSRGMRIAIAIAIVLLLPIAYNAWPQMLRSWSICSRVSDHLRSSEAAMDAGEYGLALAEAARARGLEPQNTRAILAMARARVHLLGWNPDELANTDTNELLTDARLIEKAFPGDKATVLALRGMVARHRLALEDAKNLFESALALEPTNGMAHLGLALEALRDGARGELFLEHMDAVLMARKNEPGLHALFGMALKRSGDIRSAEEAFLQAVSKRADPNWLTELATLRMVQDKAADAEISARMATRMDPRSHAAWLVLGQALVGGKKNEEAIQAFQTAVGIQETPNALFNLGAALNANGNFAQSVSVLQKLVQSGDRDPLLMSEFASSLEGMGNFQEALRIFETLASLPPQDPKTPQGQILTNVSNYAKERIAAIRSGASTTAPTPPPNAP